MLCASAGATLAVLAAVAVPGAVGAATTSASTAKAADGTAPVALGAAPLGVDVAPWDSLFSNAATRGTVESYLKAAGVDQLHYGGGVTADQYDEQTNVAISSCNSMALTSYTAACSNVEPLDFTDFSADARSMGAQSFATVNYGSGTPAIAAQWVEQSLESGQNVAQWSIGNESYGCWEANNWLAAPPEDYVGYEPNVPDTCPMNEEATPTAGMTTMTDSYAANAAQYMAAMTAVDPSIKLGVPWAFDGTVGGAGVFDNTLWNDTILAQDEEFISFVEAHWYAFSFGGDVGVGGNPSAQTVIQAVEQIPAEYAKIRSTLNTYDPKATVSVGETGVSYLATNVPCIPAGALFSAGDALEWLAAGAQNVDWWPLETGANLGTTCSAPDEGMFTSKATPNTAYEGYLLASALARPGAHLSALTTSNGDVLGFQSVLPSGQVAVELINTDTSASQKVTVGTSLFGNLSTESYSAGNQNASNTKIVDGTTTASTVAKGVTLPAESILVFKTELPSKITVGAASTVKAGTKVTISGKLTLNGATAPKGTTVKVYRRVAGSSVNSATLTTTTTASGTYSTTNTPSASGSYDYVASYPGSGVYNSSSSTVLVHVTKVKPAIKLTFSAASVKPGREVTVTAALGAWHTNRTLVIYAQPKGSAKKTVKRATINAKGKVTVSYTVKANTTFTLTFSGDGWYSSASVSAIVKT